MLRILDDGQITVECLNADNDFSLKFLLNNAAKVYEECLEPEQLALSGSELEHFLFTALFPTICVFGIVGNTIELVVLLSKKMRSSVNLLFAMLSLCDTVFLILLIPQSLANFNFIALNYHFRYYYLAVKVHMAPLANWSSAIGIWLLVVLGVERIFVIQYPFRKKWSQKRVLQVAAVTALLTFFLTFYGNYAYRCFSRSYCNGTQFISKCFDVTQDRWSKETLNPTSVLQRIYVKWSIVANAIFAVVVPITLLTVTKVILIARLKNRNRFVQKMLYEYRSCEKQHEELLQQKLERKIEITAFIVVTVFIITKVPSASILTLDTLSPQKLCQKYPDVNWYNVQLYASFLTIFGKTLTFVILCISSRNFRKQLFRLIRNIKNKRSEIEESRFIYQYEYKQRALKRHLNDSRTERYFNQNASF